MENYESERKALILWFMDELDKASEIPSGRGFDGERTQQERIISAEFHKRYRDLNKKYNIPDKKPQPTAPTMSMEEALERFMRGGES